MCKAKELKAAMLIGPALLLCTSPLHAVAQPAVPEVGGEVETGNGSSLPTSAPTRDQGAVRLANRVDVNGFATGVLQVFCDGAWGLVCDTNFDDRDALVACRQLGFTAGSKLRRPGPRRIGLPPEEELAPFALENLGCSGDEASLIDCPLFLLSEEPAAARDYSFYYQSRVYEGSGTCDHATSTFAEVVCGVADAAGEGDVRLSPVTSVASADGAAAYGRLEVFHRGGWGTVCDIDDARLRSDRDVPQFSRGAAGVACRQLGFQEGFQIQALVDSDPDSTARVPIVMVGPECGGAEAVLGDCAGFSLQLDEVGRCRHENDVYVVCSSGPDAELDRSVRLEAGSSGEGYAYGRLEVFLRGFWSNVCNAGRFTPDSAQVACRELGFDGGSSLTFRRPPRFTLSPVKDQVLFKDVPVALAAVGCEGNETSITDCQRNDNLVDTCGEFDTSTVLACAESAADCDRQEGSAEGSVRLRGGFGTPCDTIHTGYIEVLHDGEWGNICTNSIDESRATNTLVPDVVCRQLGFPYGGRVDPLPAVPPPQQGDTPSPPAAEDQIERYWLFSSETTCTGPEQRLLDCELVRGFSDAVNQQCLNDFSRHRLYVACRQFPVTEALEGVTTPGAEEGDLRLVTKTAVDNWVTGHLQVFLDGSWGQVCGGAFDAADADVACRQLGYGAGTAAARFATPPEIEALRDVAVFPDAVITSPGCDGTEARLVDCATEAAADGDFDYGPDCRTSNSLGLVIGCVADADAESGTEGAIRLTNTSAGGSAGAESGVLEVFHAGAWGSVCSGDPGFFQDAGTVACREVGFDSGFSLNFDRVAPLRPQWLSGASCSGTEAGLAACELPAFGETSSCDTSQRLFCFTASDRGSTGEVRLVGGSADPGGEWEYGRLEVLVNGFWSIINENALSQDIGRRGAEVACRSLGFAAGAELLVGKISPFPTAAGEGVQELLNSIVCNGTEGSLAECTLEVVPSGSGAAPGAESGVQFGAVSLICSNPSGCVDAVAEPVEGDVRLVPINGTASRTAACDAVHSGAVELFHEGLWGRICTGTRGDAADAFTLDAHVVCRQLGFPFGSLMDEGEALPPDYDYELYTYFDDTGGDDGSSQIHTWATEVVCTGKEERLLDCDFPQAFGASVEGDYYSFAGAALPPGGGLPRPPCGLNGNNRFAVVCRHFQIPESSLIRR